MLTRTGIEITALCVETFGAKTEEHTQAGRELVEYGLVRNLEGPNFQDCKVRE
jgi:hypothetical protein